MADGEYAHAITIGSLPSENKGGATVKADFVNLAALTDITVQNGSGIVAPGSVTLSAGGTISFTDSGISAQKVKLDGKAVVLSGAGIVTGSNATTGPAAVDNGEGTTAQAVTDPDVILLGKDGVTLSDGTMVGGANVLMQSTSGPVSVSGKGTMVVANKGDVTVAKSGSVSITDGAMVAGQNVTMSSAGTLTVSTKNDTDRTSIAVVNDGVYNTDATIKLESDGAMTVTNANIGHKQSVQGAVGIKAGQVELRGNSLTLDNASLKASRVVLDGKDGNVVLQNKTTIAEAGSATIDGKNITIAGIANSWTDETSVGAQEIKLTADENIVVKDRAKLRSWGVDANDSITLNAGGNISVSNNAEIFSNTGSVTLKGLSNTISGSSLSATVGSVNVGSSSATQLNEIRSATLTAGQNVNLSSTSKASVTTSGADVVIGSTYIDNTAVKAGGTFSITTGNLPVSANVWFIDYTAVTLPTGGQNTISNSTITADKVLVEGMMNTISGKLANADVTIGATNGVTLGVDGGSIINSVSKDAVVTTKAGNITLNGMLNNAAGKFVSTDGAVTLNATSLSNHADIEKLFNDLGGLAAGMSSDFRSIVEALGYVGLADVTITKDDEGKESITCSNVNLDLSANILDGANLSAGTGVSVTAGTGNLLQGAAITAGGNIDITGGINALMDTNVTSNGGNITVTANGGLGDLMTSVLGSQLVADVLAGKTPTLPIAGMDSMLGKVSEVTKMLDKLETTLGITLTQDTLATLGGLFEGGANVLMGGKLNANAANGVVTIKGTANAVMGGTDISGQSIHLVGDNKNLPLDDVVGSILDSLTSSGTGSQTGAEGPQNSGNSLITELMPTVTGLLKAVQDKSSVNLVWGGGTHVGDTATGTVTMTALGNVVAKNAVVWGDSVTMTGLANVLGLGAWVNGNNTVTMDGMFNVLYNGKVTGNTITMGLSDANDYKGGLTVNELVSCLPDTVSGKDIKSLKSTLSSLLTTYGPAYHNVNMLMGPDTVLTGTSVNLGGYTVMNMLSDRVKVNADSVSMSGITNILTDGTTINAGSIELAGTANLVSHLTLGDVMNALKGEELPAADAASTTTLTATNNITMWGTANVLHGGALVKSESGNVHMGGTPLGVDSLTFNQCLAMANTVGMGDKLMGTAKDMLTQLLARAGVADSAAAAQQVIDTFLKDYGDTPLPPEVLSSSLNMVSDGAKVQALNGKVSMDGTANVLLNHAEVQGKDVELTGTANAVVGGAKLYGTNIKLQGKDMELHLGALAGVILDSGVVEKVLPGVEMPTSSEVMASLLKLNEVKGSVNLVYGDNSKVGHGQTASVTMQALGNAVLDNSAVQAKDVTMTGLGNLVGLGATVTGNNTLNLDGVANVVYNGKLSGNTITMGVTKDNPYKDTLPLDAMFNLLPDTVSGYDISAIKGALPGLLSSYGPAYYNMNLVMGPDAALEGTKVYLGGNTVMNMLSDRATVKADSVVLSGFSNIVTDGTTIDAGNLEMAGTLNFVSHLTLADVMNAVQTGGNLPAVGKDTTTLTADGGLNIWGTANVVHGSVVLNSTNGNVTMGSKGTPILGIDSLTLDQCAALVKELGLYDVLTDENNTTLSDLLASAGVATGEKAEQLLAQAKGLIKELLTNYKGVELPKGLLTSNVNMVTGGAQVLADNGAVTMNGTANVLHGYKTVVNGNSVTLNGMGNVVMGGANVYGDNILLHGVDRNLNLGTIGSVLLSSGMLDSLVDKLPDGVTLPDDATLGKVLTALDKVNGSANVVWGGSTNVGDTNTQSVTMEALANIVARNAVVTADTVTMQGTGKGLKALESLTLQQCLGLAQKMGLVDTLKNAAGETLGELLTRAEAEGLDKETADKLVSEAKDMLKGFLTQYGDTTLPEEFLAGNMNLVLDGAQVTAGKDVNMSGALNTVAGGATVSAGADVNMSGGVNLVVDTTIQNVLDTITTGSLSSVTAGGNAVTTITAQDDINLNALVNVVNGGKVQLSATDEVNMTGAANMVGSKAQVSAKNINLNGKDAKLDTKLELDGIVPDRFADEAELVLNKALEEGASINLVMGGADLKADRDITMSGLASAVVDTTLGNVVDALKNQSIDPLLQGGTDETTLTAGRDINMHSKLNAVNGGRVVLSAGEDVHMEGALNVVHGDAQVSAGKQVNVRGVANLVAGGADLKGETVLLQGNDAMDDELDKVAGMLVPGLSLPTGVSGTVVMGDGTTVTATKGVTMHGNLNMVAEKAVVAGNSTYAEGTLNIVTGEAQVNAETTATMVGSMGNLVLDGAQVNATSGDISLKSSGFEHAGVDTLIDKLNNKLGGLLPDSMADLSVDLKELMAQGGVNAVMSGAHVNADSGKVTMLAAVNAIDAAQVSAQKDVVMEGRAKHILNNATVVSNEGNITISGGIGTISGTTTMKAEQGQVTIKDMQLTSKSDDNATATIVAGKGLVVQNSEASLEKVTIGGTSTIDKDSKVFIDDLSFISSTTLYMMKSSGSDLRMNVEGELTVNNYNASGTTINNVGTLNVTGTLTMQDTKLELHTDSLSDASMGINLLGDANGLALTIPGADAIGGLTVNLNMSEFTFVQGGLIQSFEYTLFSGATDDDFALVQGALDLETEVNINTIGMTPTYVGNMQLTHNANGSVVLTGTIVIPEPTTATLSLLALAGLAARRRRKN